MEGRSLFGLDLNIKKEGVNFYEGFLRGVCSIDSIEHDFMEHIPHLVKQEDNDFLTTPTTLEEVKSSTFQIHLGWMAFMVFQSCWGFMGNRIWMVVEESQKREEF
jgi:hypothetical protein